MSRKKASCATLLALSLLAAGIGVPSTVQGEPVPEYEFLCLEGETTIHCTADGEPAKVHERSEENHLLHVGAATLECGVVELDLITDADGKRPNPTTEPVYEECKDIESGEAAEVKANGCKFEYFAEAESKREGATEGELEGSMSLVCSAGQKISIELLESGCPIDILPQETIEPVYFRNMTGEPGDVTIETDEAQLTAEVTKGFFTCGVTKEHHTAEYLGNTTFRATSEGEFVDAEVGIAPEPPPSGEFEFTCLEGKAHVHCAGDGSESAMHEEARSDHTIHIGIADFTCNTALFAVTTDADGTSASAPTEPIYGECEDSVTHEVSVIDTNECEFEYTVESESGEGALTEDEFEGSASLICPASKQIEISFATGCEADLEPQTEIGPLHFRNMTGSEPGDVTIETDHALFSANFTQGFFTCGVTKGIHNIEYIGNTTVEAFNTADEQIDVEIRATE